MRLFSIIFTLLVISATYGCSTSAERPVYSEVHAQYRAMQKDIPERVTFDFYPSCNDEGDCLVREDRLNDAAKVITILNDSVSSAVTAYNYQLDALAMMEYSAMMEGYRADQTEAAMSKQATISTIKQVLTTGAAISGAMLFCQP